MGAASCTMAGGGSEVLRAQAAFLYALVATHFFNHACQDFATLVVVRESGEIAWETGVGSLTNAPIIGISFAPEGQSAVVATVYGVWKVRLSDGTAERVYGEVPPEEDTATRCIIGRYRYPPALIPCPVPLPSVFFTLTFRSAGVSLRERRF